MKNFILTEKENKLIEKNIKLAYWKAHRWAEKVHDKSLIDDFISCCEMGLIKASHTFDETRNTSFATYAKVCMDNQVKLYLRKNFNKTIPFSFLEMHCHDPDESIDIERIINISVQLEDIALKVDIERLLNRLSDKEYDVIFMYFFIGYNEYEIADIMNISQGHVSRIKSKAIEKLKIITGTINGETNRVKNG